MYKFIFKRIFDIIISFCVLLCSLPVIMVVGVLIKAFQKTSVFFVQTRPGKNNELFKLIKMKTMTDERDENGELLPDEKRLTWIGGFIRKTSLDELPQMINVLKGDMSLIGPRPLLVEYLPLYNDFQKRRHEVRPGITGWAQINGRNATTWDDRFKNDIWYVDNLSFMVDMKIVFLTILKIFKSEGISSGTSATMEKFKGSGK